MRVIGKKPSATIVAFPAVHRQQFRRVRDELILPKKPGSFAAKPLLKAPQKVAPKRPIARPLAKAPVKPAVKPAVKPVPIRNVYDAPEPLRWVLQCLAFSVWGCLFGMALTFFILDSGVGAAMFPHAHNTAQALVQQAVALPELLTPTGTRCAGDACKINMPALLDQVSVYLPPVNASALQP